MSGDVHVRFCESLGLQRPGPLTHDKEGLNFALLADEGHAVAESYEVWVTKKLYGREYLGNERTTFIIDPGGKVAEVLRKVKPAEHDALVLSALAEASP